MVRSRLVTVAFAVLMLCLLAAAGGCTQQAEPTPTLQATDTPEPSPTPEPTDRSAPPPTVQPTDTPTPAVQPVDTPEPVPTPETADTPEATPTAPPADVPLDCTGLFPTNTPDPNRPEGILGRTSEFWNVSSFEEAECITDYPIAVPANLPEGFVRGENIIVHKSGTSHFEDRWIEYGWYIPGDPPYGFRLEQHSWKLSLGGGLPAVINGIPGERHLRGAMAARFPAVALVPMGTGWLLVHHIGLPARPNHRGVLA